MAISPAKLLITLAAFAVIIELAAATNHTVGKPGGGWDLSTSLSSWASSITFKSGDNLIFSYSPSSHDVVEVDKAKYSSCTTAGAIKTYSTGNDVIPLTTEGKRYFICGFPGHCTGGMKLEIDTTAAGTAPSPPPAAPRTPPSAGPPQPSPSPPSSGSRPPSGSHPLIPVTPPPESPQADGSSPTSTPAPSAASRRSLGAAGLTGLGMLIIMCAL